MSTVCIVQDHPYNGGTFIAAYSNPAAAKAHVAQHEADKGEYTLSYSWGEYDVDDEVLL